MEIFLHPWNDYAIIDYIGQPTMKKISHELRFRKQNTIA